MEFSEGRQSGERINLGLSFASFGQAKEDENYMPVNSQYGFIFEQFDVASTIAHEVSHGAFSLHHTFSDESESYHAPQGTTPNLMDYSGGTTLNHLQWQWMHESHTNLLGFLDDESEGELKDIDSLQVLSYLEKIHKANFDNKKSLVLNIDKDWSYGKSGQIALDDSTKLNYLFMFALTSNEEKGNTISDVTTTKAISIIPYERNKTVSTNDGVSYTTYKFKTEQKFECLSFTVKTDECEVFENYLYSPNVDISDKVAWVSQFDENIFGKCTGCWRSSCCRRACEYMLGNNKVAECNNSDIAKKAPYKVQIGTIKVAYFADNDKNYNLSEYNSTPLIYDANAVDEAYNYIKSELEANRPVLIGVGHNKSSGNVPNNSNRATRHFMVVVGIGNENGVRYIRFFDAGREKQNESDAKSDANKLYLDHSLNYYSGFYNKNNYTLTEVIKY